MKRLIVIFIALASLGGVLAASWSEATRSYVHRYRMEMVVSDDGVERIGSSVVEVSWDRQPQLIVPVPEFSPKVRGEATVVVLSEKRLLVALLGPAGNSYRPVPPQNLAMRAYGLPEDKKSIPAIEKQRGPRELGDALCPDLVLFDDGNDPASGRVVRPSSDGTLAPGLVLKHISVEIVDSAVTRQIESVVPWWRNENRPQAVAVLAWNGGKFSEADSPKSLFERK